MHVSAIIVNYNTSDQTIDLVKDLSAHKQIDEIVVVDNNSQDNNANKINKLSIDNLHLLKRNINDGYGGGNNYGIKYAQQNLKSTHALIINPDVKLTCPTVEHLCEFFKTADNNVCVVAPSTFHWSGRILSWQCLSNWYRLREFGKYGRKINKNRHFYPKKYYINKDYVEVDAVLGACLMVDIDKFLNIGGYDENIFMYEEEYLLAHKCKVNNFKTILLCKDSYTHNHNYKSKPVDKIKMEKQRHKSFLYILKKYYKANILFYLFAKIYLKICLLEVR